MSRIGHLLLPLDGSVCAEAALGWLDLLPADRVTLLRVAEAGEEADVEAEHYLAATAARHAPTQARLETLVVTGDPAEAIVAAATDADLIVMCTRGRGGGGRLLFGSVADRVARHAPVPALLVRGGHAPVAAAPLDRVVVPLDGSAPAELALPWATTLATALGRPIELITVIDDADAGQARVETPEAASAYLEQVAERMRQQGVEAAPAVRRGAPEQELLNAVGPGDLLVLTTHGHGAAKRWQVGHVAERLLRRATAPAVVVRADLA
ncbi:MAG: universal stress protein [Thermomicrobiales bacterium]|nr:universal stress protein [Thermomicrobiales bacterium]